MAEITILLVDFEQNIAGLMGAHLQGAGYRIVVAHDADSAMEVIKQEPLDLLITDVVLPDLDGLLLVNAVRRDLGLARLPVVILTALTSDAEKLTALESGADDYITRPVSPREVVARVKAILRRAQSPTGAPKTEEYLNQKPAPCESAWQ